ncbi:MAG: hypothetical protein V7752_16920 [Halopseudomonas sp.]
MAVVNRLNKAAMTLCLAAIAAISGAGQASNDSKSEVEFSLSVVDQHLNRADNVIRVKQGDQVRLHWSSDQTTKIHLHGYDIEQTLTPSVAVTMSFDAFATGRFPVNLHQPGQRKGGHHGNVLLYFEVMPR